jgi:hypothetical protein
MNIGSVLSGLLQVGITLAEDETELQSGVAVSTPIIKNVASEGGKPVNLVIIVGSNVEGDTVSAALNALNAGATPTPDVPVTAPPSSS